MPTQRKAILYIAASLDGYIAKPNDDLSFLSIVENGSEDYGYHQFLSTVDTVVLGRKTYDWVMTQVPEFPHADLETYVITRQAMPDVGEIHFYSGDLPRLLAKLKAEDGQNIFIDGGAELVNHLLKNRLIDEIILSIIPILLGEGVRLFQDIRIEQRLTLLKSQTYEKGLVQLHYKRADDDSIE